MEDIDVNVSFSERLHHLIYAGDMNLIYALLLLMVIDIITGLCKAVKNKNLRSKTSMYGFFKKIFVLFIIVLANVLDNVLKLNGGLVVATLIFYIVNEGLSILENCSQLGIIVPPVIYDKLKVMQDENNGKKDEKDEVTRHGDDRQRKD